MFIMDVPYAPAQDTPIVLAQAAAPGSTEPQPDYLFNACKDTTSLGDPMSAERGVNPAGMLATYIGNRDNRPIDRATRATIKTTLLQGTMHGKLIPHTTGDGRSYFMYDPIPGYTGSDQAVFMAEFEGKRYKIVVELRVAAVEAYGNETSCPPPRSSKSTASRCPVF